MTKQEKTALLPRLALLLYAVSPLFETTEWLFYTSSVIICGLFALWLIRIIQVYRNDGKNLIYHIFGNPRCNIYDLGLAGLGITVSYVTMPNQHPILWWVLLIAAIGELVFPMPRPSEEK